MDVPVLDFPGDGEYAPFYAGYVRQLAAADLIDRLRRQPQQLHAAAAILTDDGALFRYNVGKWSIKEVIGHISDTERVFSYRLLRIGRGDSTPLPGFEQESYCRAGRFDRRPLIDLLEEFSALRRTTLALIDGFPDGVWSNRGVMADSPVTARGLTFIIAGHVEHHLQILRDRYHLALPPVQPAG